MSKPKFKVGQVVAMKIFPEFRPQYGRVELLGDLFLTVRFYDAEGGDFSDESIAPENVRPLTRRERGGV